MPIGFSLNPDELEAALATTGRLDLGGYGLTATTDEVRSFCRAHPLGTGINADNLQVTGTDLTLVAGRPSGYLAAVLSDWLRRRRWLAEGQSFTFETVMSSEDKVVQLEQARRDGFRSYTYFICTSQPSINIDRVAFRVTEGGHNVPVDKIVARHARSIALLPRAVAASDLAFLFDNSSRVHRFFAEYEDGKLVAASQNLPNWFMTTMLNVRPLP